ncbi:TRI15 protein, partial [Semnornis frantzii]|nr:TRI15 protein [Semnornis frantzii]
LREQEVALLAQLDQAQEELAKQRSQYISRASEKRSLLDTVIAELEKKCDQTAVEFLMVRLSPSCVAFPLSCEAAKVPIPEPVSPELQRHIGNLCEMSQLVTDTVASFKVKVTLDLETASPDLVVSEDCRSMRLGDGQQNLPSTPKRFMGSPSVLGSQG